VDRQLICEGYAILPDLLEVTPPELHDIFSEWNRGDLDSFLIEITANIFTKNDPDTGKALVDVILDKAGQKGTGRWTGADLVSYGRGKLPSAVGWNC
jgi:6-phosphogluconate dehydrogenase